jgi:hypothetical protein
VREPPAAGLLAADGWQARSVTRTSSAGKSTRILTRRDIR